MSKRKNKVYFIRAIDKNGKAYGSVKIGMSNNPKNELMHVQSCNRNKLKLVSTLLGGKKRERMVYDKFKDSRLTVNWFKPTKKLLDFINNLNRSKLHNKTNSKLIISSVTKLNKNISNVFVSAKNFKHVVLTHKLFELGMSKYGAWSDKQLNLLNVEIPKKKGWKHKIIGNTYHASTIGQFICLKNAHLCNRLNSFRYGIK